MVLKVNVDFGFFPDAQTSPSSEETVLNINIRLELGLERLDKQRVDIESIYRNVGSVRLPYLLVKNFNSKKSKVVIDARQTQSFAVKKNNFENIVNMVYANR